MPRDRTPSLDHQLKTLRRELDRVNVSLAEQKTTLDGQRKPRIMNPGSVAMLRRRASRLEREGKIAEAFLLIAKELL